MAKNNNAKKEMTLEEMNAMTVTVKTETGEKVLKLVDFITDRQYVDETSKQFSDYNFPKVKAVKNGKPVVDTDTGKEIYYPVYYVCKLAVTFKQDEKNVTTGTKEEKIAKNEEIMKNAKGFKAVCRDLSAMAGKEQKGFLKLTASLPCDKNVSMNETVTGLWLFTSKSLRENFLKTVQTGILDNKYVLVTGERGKAKRKSKRIEQIAKAFGISYEEAEKKMKSVK